MTAAPLSDPCAQEPIRIPGGVQPHGCLLVLAGDLTVLQASDNVGAWLGLTWPAEAARFEDIAGAGSLAGDLRAWAAGEEPLFLRSVEVFGQPLQLSAHRTAQGLIVEFERGPASDLERLEGPSSRLRGFIETITELDGVEAGCAEAARTVRALTNFDRVLVYRFDADWNGEVLAEDGTGALPSYLGQYFPASDIPAQARDLYRLNRLRLIPTAHYAPARILPTMSPVDGQPLDLSGAALRSVSPIHLQYMRNMGTLASMSISILADGRLWGLIACHSANPRLVNPQLRAACDIVGRVLSLQIGLCERAAGTVRRVELKAVETGLLTRLAIAGGVQAGLQDKPDALIRLTHAEGAAVIIDGAVIRVGRTPDEQTLTALAAWLRDQGDAPMFITDQLSSHWPPAKDLPDLAAGLLAIAVSQARPDYILWFRPEVVRTVHWAGDPRKPATETGQMNPRLSFDRWKEEVRLRSLRWGEEEVASAADFREVISTFILSRAGSAILTASGEG